MSGIFGGSKSSSVSQNTNKDLINNKFGSVADYAGQGGNLIMQLLGGDSSGFNKFKDATGFDFASDQGSRGITGNAAARGMLRSGSTGKGLVSFGNNLQQQFSGNYLDKLMGLTGLGTQAGGLMAEAGKRSEENQQKKDGMGGFLGQLASGFAKSDPRLKMDVTEIGELPDGLKIYEYWFIDGSGPYVGVMADEVAEIRPEALGPLVEGTDFQTVNYDKIWDS